MMEKNQQTLTNNINYQFKLLCAMGICFVVSGHCGSRISLFYEFFEPYAFHLGMFVFVSGYFYKEINEKKIRHYIIIFLEFFLCSYCIYQFFYGIYNRGGEWENS